MNLAKDEVHVWRADLDLPAEQVQKLAETLCADEKIRADRFRFERDRQRFIVGRGRLRTILGRYLDIEPRILQFEYSPRGKPKLAESCGGNSLKFNLSHSQGLALFGLTKDREIGIDLEYTRPMPNALNIAQRFFSAREYALISSLSESEQQKAFFLTWTAKEAYLKATGDGLAGSLDRIEISLTPGESPRLLSIEGDSQAAACWYLYSLAPKTDYIATLAVSNSKAPITVRHLTC